MALVPLAAFGQDAPVAGTPPSITVPSPILTLDQDRLYNNSAWGKRARAETEAATAALAAENRRIESELTAEERALTDRRPSMTPEVFRAAADEFDARVVDIRASQDKKAVDLTRRRDAERQAFYSAAFPVLGEVLRTRGAVAILDNRAIFLSLDAIDVTDDLVALVDNRIGAGSTVVLPGAAPEPGSVAPPHRPEQKD
jgi:Skp family chaperone for outer membrane proteins